MRGWVIAAALGAAAGASHGQEGPLAAPKPAMVFFDWGEPDLRSDDAAILDGIAETWRSRPGARLHVAGHTDRSGSAAANRVAGLRRARTVRDELEKRGIARSAISIVSFGEDQPLVPTEDGVREVQNRRVVIAFEE